ncbi:MAG: hypothetical protein PHT94_03250 [Candidatus Nanoarchaeia archaeon]|nr:hypothetical protein [Candidatus Nanoarchaeia archaeon]
MALFKKKNETKDNNVLQPGLKPVAQQNRVSNNELDLSSVNSIEDENFSNGLPDLDLPDFDSLLNENDSNSLKKIPETKQSNNMVLGNESFGEDDKSNIQNSEIQKTSENLSETEIPEIKDEISNLNVEDSVNLFDGDYFVSLNNYKAIFDRLDDLNQNFKDFNKISDEFFSLYNGKEGMLKNSDSAFEEIHRKILLIDGICFKDD